MKIGELVWVRNNLTNSSWGIIIDYNVIYLTDNSAMVSYDVLIDSRVLDVDVGDLLRFHYYNRHLYDEAYMENR